MRFQQLSVLSVVTIAVASLGVQTVRGQSSPPAAQRRAAAAKKIVDSPHTVGRTGPRGHVGFSDRYAHGTSPRVRREGDVDREGSGRVRTAHGRRAECGQAP